MTFTYQGCRYNFSVVDVVSHKVSSEQYPHIYVIIETALGTFGHPRYGIADHSWEDRVPAPIEHNKPTDIINEVHKRIP